MVGTACFAVAASALLLGSVSALGTNYEHDATTTYCWAIPRFTNQTKLTEADRTTAFAGTENCPLKLSLELSSESIHVFDLVQVKWTVTADFTSTNAINNTQIYLGRDSNNKLVQIVHSNVHSCVFGTGCDPFNDGQQLVDKTVNKPANFTDSAAIFTDTIRFPTPGEYSLLAHIILPNFNVSSRFDYAVYTKVIVLAAAATTAPVATSEAPSPVVTNTPAASTTSESGGMSQEATIGIIVGVVVLVVALIVATVIYRRRNNGVNANYSPAPINDNQGHSAAANKHQSDITMTNSTTGFESAWGGEQRLSNTGLDNTNQSNASSTYSAPRPSNRSTGTGTGAFSSAMQQQDLATSTYSAAGGGRKKRVDSDVEL